MSTISVIIPTFNRKALLAETLDSILQQTLPASEIIVVDDHSTDGTLEFLKEKYSQVIGVSNKGKGPGAARNTGFKVSTGRYVKFFDSDDLMTHNTLEAQCNLLDNSDKGFVYSPYFYATQRTENEWAQTELAILNYHPFGETRQLHYWMAVKNLFITIPGMLFKRDLLEEVGSWREDVTASEDWEYLWRISLLEPNPLHTNACAFLYRVHGEQTTESNLSDVQRDKDKRLVMEDILTISLNDATVSKKEKTFIENKLYQMYRTLQTGNTVEMDGLGKYNTFKNKWIWQRFRLEQKLGRLETKTNWQPCHGPLVSEAKFREYLELI